MSATVWYDAKRPKSRSTVALYRGLRAPRVGVTIRLRTEPRCGGSQLICAAFLRAVDGKQTVVRGRAHGVDIDAFRDGRRWMVEVKGCGSRNAMPVNYFLATIGELLQRMNDPSAKYSLAFPDLAQFRGLWERLPRLAKQRTGITCLFVTADGAVSEVE